MGTVFILSNQICNYQIGFLANFEIKTTYTAYELLLKMEWTFWVSSSVILGNLKILTFQRHSFTIQDPFVIDVRYLGGQSAYKWNPLNFTLLFLKTRKIISLIIRVTTSKFFSYLT